MAGTLSRGRSTHLPHSGRTGGLAGAHGPWSRILILPAASEGLGAGGVCCVGGRL